MSHRETFIGEKICRKSEDMNQKLGKLAFDDTENLDIMCNQHISISILQALVPVFIFQMIQNVTWLLIPVKKSHVLY